MPKKLPGPYGSLPECESTNPRRLNAHDRQVFTAVARDYILNGADMSATNTFQLRKELNEGRVDEYRSLMEEHIELIHRVCIEGGRNIPLAVSLGPKGDCYTLEGGPKTLQEGVDHWREAFAPVIAHGAQVRFALVETIGSALEALAARIAWEQSIALTSVSIRNRLELVLSLIPQAGAVLIDQTPVTDLIKAIHRDYPGIHHRYGFNCCDLDDIEPTLRSISNDRIASRANAKASFLYGNASVIDPKILEQKKGSHASRPAQEVGKTLLRLTSEYRAILHDPYIGECCGGTPSRNNVIAHHIHTRSQEVPVS